MYDPSPTPTPSLGRRLWEALLILSTWISGGMALFMLWFLLWELMSTGQITNAARSEDHVFSPLNTYLMMQWLVMIILTAYRAFREARRNEQ